MLHKVTTILGLMLFAACGEATAKQTCESLASLKLSDTTITLAESVSAGAYVPAGSAAPAPIFKTLAAFCRVTATVKPAKDSDIKVEVWMPSEAWNGKYRGTGNGGFAGNINYQGIGLALQQGYATASTDTGHASAQMTDASWALGHPEKITDYGYRAIHEMTRVAKAAIKAYYGSAPRSSYFASCSNGGRQGLMEAQRYPEDYDGIVAGAPANALTHEGLWTNELAEDFDHGGYISPAKFPAIARAVLAACDALDGVTDGIIDDPRQCRFKPEVLLCAQADSQDCLTAPQVATLKKLYAGPHDSKGKQLFPGYLPGAEDGPGGMATWMEGPAPGKGVMFVFNQGLNANMVYEKPDWTLHDAGLDEVVKADDAKLAKILNATDTNLAAFKARGGKLIIYHGWSDAALSPLNTISYYESLISTMGRTAADDFARLFMVPGMLHCSGGPGPDSFGQPFGISADIPHDPEHDIQQALEQWVEKAIPPTSLIATKYVDGDASKGVKMTRPLCAYPQVAAWSGNGSSDDAANFACKVP
jgi:hypothetical protein